MSACIFFLFVLLPVVNCSPNHVEHPHYFDTKNRDTHTCLLIITVPYVYLLGSDCVEGCEMCLQHVDVGVTLSGLKSKRLQGNTDFHIHRSLMFVDES